jgi:hypothetical protein
MKRLIVAAICCLLTFILPTATYAISAQWDLDPISGDWNTAANWTPNGVPNGPADIATFGLSNTTDVFISANTEVNGITFTSAATNPYNITASPGLTLTISGVGITNNSGVTQNFVTGVDGTGNRGQIVFRNSATAGTSTMFTNNGASVAGSLPGGATALLGASTAANGTFINNGGTSFGHGADTFGGNTYFKDFATAANGTFINNAGAGFGGTTTFYNHSTAANGMFTNNSGGGDGGATAFYNQSTAANGTFTNNGGVAGEGGTTTFYNHSTAAHGTFTNNGGTGFDAFGGATAFYNHSTAANGTFINYGGTIPGEFTEGSFTLFEDRSTAGFATLIAYGGINGGEGGAILFSGTSTGGTSRVEVFGNGNLDIGPHQPLGVTIGSI